MMYTIEFCGRSGETRSCASDSYDDAFVVCAALAATQDWVRLKDAKGAVLIQWGRVPA